LYTVTTVIHLTVDISIWHVQEEKELPMTIFETKKPLTFKY